MFNAGDLVQLMWLDSPGSRPYLTIGNTYKVIRAEKRSINIEVNCEPRINDMILANRFRLVVPARDIPADIENLSSFLNV